MAPISTANSMPFSNPTAASFQITRNAFDLLRSRIASARTTTVTVWVPALPPIEATIGMRTASATTCAMVASKIAITPEARIAVPRLMSSQRKRCFVVSSTLLCRSDSDTPPRRRISSSASSSTISTTSSTVTRPSSLPLSFTTGAETSPYWRNR